MKQGEYVFNPGAERPKEHCVSITVHCKVRMIGGPFCIRGCRFRR